MSQTMTMPQHALDHYNVHYNSQTYTAFSLALATVLGLDERVVRLEAHDGNHNRIMNLLIDASMELVGSEYHAGAGQRVEESAAQPAKHRATVYRWLKSIRQRGGRSTPTPR